MDRLVKIRSFVDKVLLNMGDTDERRCGYVHLYGVSQFCAQLALKRNLNPEIVSIAGMLHDIYYYRTGLGDNHACNSAEYMRPVLRDMEIFTEDERRLILSAIYNHSDKKNIHGDYDELLKDADVIQHFLYNTNFEVLQNDMERMKKLFKELSFNNINDYNLTNNEKGYTSLNKKNKRKLLADIAESLANKEVVGEKNDDDYNNIVKYWPESNIHEELKNSWCAAFVYHCCYEAGFKLPIRHPKSHRFVGVLGWYQWAILSEIGFYIEDGEGIIPKRGDIVIYNNIIPKKNKKENDILPRDHIGVVLEVENDTFTVAEGNVNNQNKAGIVKRRYHENIDGFIRIRNDYEFKGIEYDYIVQ